jgi:hypothetical protein
VRRLLADNRRDRSAVPKAIDEILVLATVGSDPHAAGDTVHVRVRGVDAAIDYCNAQHQITYRPQRHRDTETYFSIQTHTYVAAENGGAENSFLNGFES